MKLYSRHYPLPLNKLLLFAVVLGLLVSSCAKSAGNPNPPNQTAVAAIVQTVNANVTPTERSGAPAANAEAPLTQSPPAFEGEAFDRRIWFSGYEWTVKSSTPKVGPGPNFFSNQAENVWVDETGQLHLNITQRDGKWYCAEVATADALGYGSYQFKVASPAGILDKNAVLGLFTWDTTAPQFNYREIDIELSQWGEDTGQNAQFVVQPWDHAGNRHRFMLDPQAGVSTSGFIWTPASVQFFSFLGSAPSPASADIVEQWSYTGADIPPADSGHTRINLWLIDGRPPSGEKEIEMILSSFHFIPQTVTK